MDERIASTRGRRRLVAVLAATAAASAMAPGAAQAAEALYGVTADSRLVQFDSDGPSHIRHSVPISGLQSGEAIVGIDVRPATDQLYALGSSSRVYVVNPVTGATRAVGNGPLSTPLAGASFGFDFNPTVDRIRVVSDQDQNLRLNPDTGAATNDAPLNYAAGDPGTGSNPQVVGSAYTNSVPGATMTQLFGIDSGRDSLVLQSPPNDGTLKTVGALGVDVGDAGGFDIAASGGTAYAAFTPQGGSAPQLYTVNLTTGAATVAPRGRIGSGNLVALAAAGTVADDTDGPSLLVTADRTQKKRSLRTRGLSVGAACDETCRVTATLTLGGRVIGRKTRSIAGAGNTGLRVRLNATGRRLVSRNGAKRLKLTTTAVDAAGNTATRRRTVVAR